MIRYLLQEEIAFNFNLIGISSHYRDYRICWAINKVLNFDFQRSESEIVLHDKGRKEMFAFASFHFLCPDSDVLFELISNKSENGYLIPEMKQADYFLKFDDYFDDSVLELVQKLRNVAMVNMAFQIDPDDLRSKLNLIY